MKKGLVGLLLFGVICFAACHKTTVTPTLGDLFKADSVLIVNYLADNHINAIDRDSVWYVIREVGTGPKPTRYNCVLVKYSAYELGTSTPFQTSVEPGFKAPLKSFNGVIGLQIALKEFPTGSKGTVYIPSLFGYGVNGTTDSNGAYVVHPNTCLIFDIELIALSDYNVLGNYCYE